MPYKDLAVRKEFQRRYKRKWRARANGLKKFRIYCCPRYPDICICGCNFIGGFLVTDSPEVQAAVERSPDFFRFIFPIRLDFSGPTLKKEEA